MIRGFVPEPFAGVTSVRIGNDEQLATGVGEIPVAVFSDPRTPAELVANPAIPPGMPAMRLGVIEPGMGAYIKTTAPVHDIFLVGDYLP